MKTPAIIIFACIVLNVVIGSITYYLKLPIYLDSIGIMLSAFLVAGENDQAFIVATIVAVVSFLVIGLFINHYQIWFIATAVVDAAFGAFVVRDRVMDLITSQVSFATFIKKTGTYGVAWGIIAALVSAPIVICFFKGITSSGTALIISDFMHAGYRLPLAALFTGAIAELIDKTLTMLCALLIARVIVWNWYKCPVNE